MKLTTASIALLAGLAAANPLPAPATVSPADYPSFSVSQIVYAGTGCPAGSVNLVNAADPTAITFRMSGYVASIGPNEPITNNRRNCQLNLKVVYPSNWQYSVVRARYVGSAYLQSGVRGLQKATYYFAGETDSVSAQTPFYGPYSGGYDLSDTINTGDLQWSECGSGVPLNINSELRLSTSNKQAWGQMSTDFEQIHELQWRRC